MPLPRIRKEKRPPPRFTHANIRLRGARSGGGWRTQVRQGVAEKYDVS